MTPFDFHFLRPLWLLLSVPLALLLWRLRRIDGEANAWRGVVDAHLLPRLLSGEDGRARRLPLILLAVGWLLAVLALAGPTWQRLPQPLFQAQQYRVIALDLSPSMHAGDLKPSRLAHARYEVLDMLRRAGEGQTALIAYGAEPFVVSPLTTDTATIAAQVPLLDTGLLPVGGARRSDLALQQAGELLQQAEVPDGDVILVTDAVEHPAATVEAARRLHTAGYRVSVLGVGTAKGAPIALPGGGFAKDERGAIVLPKLDAEVLDEVATAGGGRYVTASLDDRDIATLLPAGAARTGAGAEQQDASTEQWREEGPWLLLLLLPLGALAFRRGWVSPLVLLVLVQAPPDAYAIGWDELWQRADQQAQRRLEAGQPADAAALFERPDWRAAAHYQAGDYAQALQILDDQQGAASAYNRGNTLARLGRLEDAVAAYDGALAVDPSDADARHNRELVQALLDRQQAQRQRPAQDEGPPAEDRQRPQDASQPSQDQPSEDQQEAQDQQQQGQSAQSGEPREQAEEGKQDDTADQGGESSQGEQNASQQAAEESGRGDPQPGEQAQGGASAGADAAQTGSGAEQQDQAGQTADAQRDEQRQDAAGERQGEQHEAATGQGQAVDQPDAAGEPRDADEKQGEQGEAQQLAADEASDSGQPGAAGEPQDAAQAMTQDGGQDAADRGEQAERQGDGQQTADTTQGADRAGDDQARDGEQAGTSGSDTQQAGADQAGGQDAGHDGARDDAGGGQGVAQDAPADDAKGTADRADGQGPGDQPGPPDAATAGAPQHADTTPGRPGLADLMGGDQPPPQGVRRPMQTADGSSEDLQALEQMLRRVEDDPGGLLRQRFLLQHLRRSGQLP